MEDGLVLCDSVVTVIRTYGLENHDSLQARGEEYDDRWWKVANKPNNEHRELCQREDRQAHVDCFDNVSLKIRER